MREIVVPEQVQAVERLQLAEADARNGVAEPSWSVQPILCFDGGEG